jgi:hypothetical protein
MRDIMQIGGKILEIFQVQAVSATFRKREFVVEYVETQYPEFIKFETVQDKCDILDNFSAGDQVDVDFNLKGRKWTNPQGEVKYFNSMQAWRVVPQQQNVQDGAPPPENFSEVPPPGFDQNLQEDVPF